MHLDSPDPECYLSDVLPISPAGNTLPRTIRQTPIHPVSRRLMSGPEVPGRGQEEAGASKPMILAGEVSVRTALSRPQWRGQKPAPSSLCSRWTLMGSDSRM